jgi:hypothetical protein
MVERNQARARLSEQDCLLTATAALALAAGNHSFSWASSTDCAALLARATKTELSLPSHQFDQDERRGWRALAAVGCTAEAAILVERYLIGYESNLRSLKWHHAQLLATAGMYKQAVAAARHEGAQHPSFKWNAYVLATIAFLEKNLDELERQAKVIEAAVETEPMNKVNLEVVRGLARCIGQPYKTAYSCRSAA